jgi:Cu/Ag efflux protein CusF
MRLLCALSFALLSISTPPAFAQHDHHRHAMPMAAQSSAQSAVLTDGLVKKIDAKAGEVVIQHGPLDSIGMPPMTMAFGVADKAWLGKLKAGDKIRFAAEMKAGNAIVSRYEMAK